MKNTYTYFVRLTPFRVIRKYISRTLIISKEGDYFKVHSIHLSKFNEGDYILKSKMMGEGIVNINYVLEKDNKKKNRGNLENLFSKN